MELPEYREIKPELVEEMQEARERQTFIEMLDSAIDIGVITYDDASWALESYDNMGERPEITKQQHEGWKQSGQIDGQLKFDV